MAKHRAERKRRKHEPSGDSPLARAKRAVRALERKHVELFFGVLEADGGAVFGNDLVSAGAIQRSLLLTQGFLAILRTQNYLCAGALLRMQVDTLLRLFAASLFPSGNEPLQAFLEDRPLNKLRAPDGARLTEKELCRRASMVYEWVPRVYAATSGFVHFSGPSIMSAISGVNQDGSVSISVGSLAGRRWRVEERLEATEAFGAATQAILDMVYSWGHTKALAASKRKESAADTQASGVATSTHD
jgi:hypothetical protein